VQDPAICQLIVDQLQSLGVTALITVGGDGTAGAASTIHRYAGGAIRVVHVPKTIDNDIPLPGGFSTFGYQTARDAGVSIVERLMVDARTTGRWFICVTMGRQTGHLALGIGKAAGATLTLIPEEFPDRVTLDDIMRPIEGSIIRRLCDDREDGVVVLAEGLAEKLDPRELGGDEHVERDPHGKVRLQDLPLGLLLRRRLTDTFAARGIKLSIMEKVVGYELRCAAPNPFDAEYVRDLGFGAMRAIDRGTSGGIVCRSAGRIAVHPFVQFQDPRTGLTRVRYVDIETESFEVSMSYQLRLRETDLADPARVKKLAAATGMTAAELRARFTGYCPDTP